MEPRDGASDGTLQNLFYAFNWWIFAGLVVYGWGKTLREDLPGPTPRTGGDTGNRRRRPYRCLRSTANSVRPSWTCPIEDDPELVAYNAYLARLNERSGR